MPERVWERYLSPQDKADIARRKRHNTVGFGQRPGLLLVDLYRAVFGDRPRPLLEVTDEWPASCGLAAWDAVPHIKRLLSAARDAEIPIVHITMLTGTGVDGWGVPKGGRAVGRGELPAHLRGRSDLYEIIPEVGPLPGETLIRKASPSAFWGTPLTAHLSQLELDTLIVCGESTSGCVRATVVDACTNRYKVIVAEEGVFDRHEACHAISLFDMNQKYADVLPVNEIVGWLRDWRAGMVQAKELVTAPT